MPSVKNAGLIGLIGVCYNMFIKLEKKIDAKKEYE